MRELDLVRLRHMLDAAREMEALTSGMSRDDFKGDRVVSLAVVRLLEVLGEAASGVSEGLRSRHAKVPWSRMIAMRNRLIHGYYDLDLDIVWSTVSDDIPPLVRMLEDVVRAEGSG
jgi:uncharacterized protein with HEPN domain